MSFMPEKGGKYYFTTRVGLHPRIWLDDSTDIRIARSTGIFPFTTDGGKLAKWRHAFITDHKTFWEWVDDYELHT